MNIFDNYLAKISKLILDNKESLKLKNLDNLKNINLEVPPEKFNFDLSTNISLMLSKPNKLNSNDLAHKIKEIFVKGIIHFEKVEVAGPGFINIKLSKDGILSNIKDIFNNKDSYGANKSNKTFNIEFVSANPTGPMHVGHCRGAIFGDVLSNLLSFNGNKVVKEYYINDYGSQIKNFVESVYQRIREIKYNEKFIAKKNLYPGKYIKDIANNILKQNKNIVVNNFQESFKELKQLSLKESMSLIKNDLKLLGITHDNFFSETNLVNKDLVSKAVIHLKKGNYVEEGFLAPQKVKLSNIGKK